MNVLIQTLTGPFSKAFTANDPPATFATTVPLYQQPTGDGTVDLGSYGAVTCNNLLLIPYSEGGNPGDQFSMRLWGWRQLVPDSNPTYTVWLPYLLGQYLCTVAKIPGPASPLPPSSPTTQPRFLTANETLCDTIVAVHGFRPIIVSPGSDASPDSNLTAWILQDVIGSQVVSFDFQNEGSFAGNMNCAYVRA